MGKEKEGRSLRKLVLDVVHTRLKAPLNLLILVFLRLLVL